MLSVPDTVPSMRKSTNPENAQTESSIISLQDGQYYNQLLFANKNTEARSEATCRRSHSYSIAKLEFELLSLCPAASVLNRSAAIIP